MDAPDQRNTTWWITSLAISVVCCSILFVVFAGYLVEVKENLAVTKLRFDMIEERLRQMSIDIEALRRRSSVQQIQLVPPAGVSIQGPSPDGGQDAPVAPLVPTSPVPAPEVPARH